MVNAHHSKVAWPRDCGVSRFLSLKSVTKIALIPIKWRQWFLFDALAEIMKCRKNRSVGVHQSANALLLTPQAPNKGRTITTYVAPCNSHKYLFGVSWLISSCGLLLQLSSLCIIRLLSCWVTHLNKVQKYKVRHLDTTLTLWKKHLRLKCFK